MASADRNIEAPLEVTMRFRDTGIYSLSMRNLGVSATE